MYPPSVVCLTVVIGRLCIVCNTHSLPIYTIFCAQSADDGAVITTKEGNSAWAGPAPADVNGLRLSSTSLLGCTVRRLTAPWRTTILPRFVGKMSAYALQVADAKAQVPST
jgi:hypothetical protein